MLGLLEIRRRKLQFGLVGLIVVLITYLVLMVNGLGIGLRELSGTALRSWDADAIVYSDTANLSIVRSEMGQDSVDRARQAPGVTDSAALGYFSVNVRKLDGSVSAKAKSAAVIGFDLGTIAQPAVTAGRNLEPGEADAVLADASFLQALDLHVGDTVKLGYRLTSSDFRIVGEIDQGSLSFQPTLYTLRSTWQSMRYGASTPETPAASIVLLKGKGLAGTSGEGFTIVSKDTAFNSIEGVSAQNSTVNALMAFGYIIGAVTIGVFFYVLTLQKVAQVGVLKAVGASTAYVARQVIVQVMAVALVGVGIAVPLAFFTNAALQQLPDRVPIAFTTSAFVTTSTAMVVTALLGAVFSLREVAKVDPIIALGQQQ